jgi:alkylhydroperoxidase family enzyme
VQFALKVATNPQGLRAEDYDEVRAYGITNEEIIEIVMIAGMALFNDVLADSLKIEVDPEVADALGK